MLGHKNSPQLPIKIKIAKTAKDGLIKGKSTLKNICRELHPSITADSSSSLGTAKNACLKRKIPNAFTAKGKIKP